MDICNICQKMIQAVGLGQNPHENSWPASECNGGRQVSPEEQNRTLFLRHVEQLRHCTYVVVSRESCDNVFVKRQYYF